MSGFFKESLVVSKASIVSDVPRCGACGLYRTCESPKMPVTGEGRRRILIIAEAPGKTEDEEGVQLVGESGKYLRKVLRRHDVDLDEDCWKTNAIICRPPNNRTPTSDEIEYCRPNVINTIKDLKPSTIILLGGVAVHSLIGWLWKEDLGPIARWVGWQIPNQRLNAWICPTYHPAHVLREEKNTVLALWFDRHIQQALQFDLPPYYGEEIPDYCKQVKLVYSPDEAAKIIRKMVELGGPVAFDFETNMLKPDWPKAKIVSCSICWHGQKTIAYPWHGEAIQATKELIRSPQPKIAANMKFEQRWVIKEFGHGVRNWVWDTMQAAHIIDNRPTVTGLKFQSFVQLGQEAYDNHIEQFLSDTDINGINRIDQIDLPQLLEYNGIDSVLEYKLAEKQMKVLGCSELLFQGSINF